jgi:serine/threonine-protein kinase RsbW
MSKRLLSVAPSPAAPTGAAAFDVRCAADIAPVLDGVTSAMVRQGYPGRDVFALRLALEEALVNALKHGHGYDPARRARVRYQVTRRQVLARVTDEGAGFDPAAVADPLGEEGLERPSGRGLLLMRRFLSWVRYNRRGNGVTLCRRRSPA